MNPPSSILTGPGVPRRSGCRTFKILKVAAGFNFVVSCMVVLAWIGYGLYRHLPLNVECLGLHSELGTPAFVDCGIVTIALLLVFLRRRHAAAWKVRLFFVIIGTWGFVWSVLLPFVFQDPGYRYFFRDFHHVTFDTVVGWYAFASAVVLGLAGPSGNSVQATPLLAHET